MAKNLMIYYSRKGEYYWNGGIRKIEKGNTEIVAEFIPMAVFTQLERLDWKGKKVMAVMTHEGSGLGNCERD